jgi:hypothetical protein
MFRQTKHSEGSDLAFIQRPMYRRVFIQCKFSDTPEDGFMSKPKHM